MTLITLRWVDQTGNNKPLILSTWHLQSCPSF